MVNTVGIKKSNDANFWVSPRLRHFYGRPDPINTTVCLVVDFYLVFMGCDLP